MMEEESSSDRSVNSGTKVGAVTRMIRKAKKPISAIVTAPMAARRVGPSVLTKSIRPCTRQTPIWARFATESPTDLATDLAIATRWPDAVPG